MDLSKDKDNMDFGHLNEVFASKNNQVVEEKVPWQDVEPVCVTSEEFRDIFGDSSDEETEFYGFSERELGLKEFRSVMSPNKLKFQDDFYMPLFLSHRRRNRDLVLEKAGKLEKETRKSLDALTSDNKCEVGKKKKTVDCIKNIQGEFNSMELDNPYAKTYKSYRRDRSRSFPLPVPKSELKVENKEQTENKAPAGRQLTDEMVIASTHGSDAAGMTVEKKDNECTKTAESQVGLIMKIHYQSHVRPKRKVIVQEKDDFVYSITLPSKKRARTLSPTVITSAKILQRGPIADEVSPMQEKGPIEAAKEDETELETSITMQPDCSKGLPSDALKEVIDKSNTRQETNFQQEFEVEHDIIVKPESYIGKVHQDSHFKQDSKINQDSDIRQNPKVGQDPKVDELPNVSKVINTEPRPKRKKRFKNFRDPNEGYQRAVLSDIFQEAVPRDSVSEPACTLSVDALKKEKSIVEFEDKVEETAMKNPLETSNEKPVDLRKGNASLSCPKVHEHEQTKRNRENNDKRPKRQSRYRDSLGETTVKPKDFNLTDSWFIVNPTPSKKRSSSTKAVPKSENSQRKVKDDSAFDATVEQRSIHQAPSLGKFVSVEGRKSVTRKRRLKNVTYSSVVDLTSNVGDTAHLGVIQPEQRASLSDTESTGAIEIDDTAVDNNDMSNEKETYSGNEENNIFSKFSERRKGSLRKSCSEAENKEQGKIEKSAEESSKENVKDAELFLSSSSLIKDQESVAEKVQRVKIEENVSKVERSCKAENKTKSKSIDAVGQISTEAGNGDNLGKEKPRTKVLRSSLAGKRVKNRGRTSEKQIIAVEINDDVGESSVCIKRDINGEIETLACTDAQTSSSKKEKIVDSQGKFSEDNICDSQIEKKSYSFADTSVGIEELKSQESEASAQVTLESNRIDNDSTPAVTFSKPLAMIEGKKFAHPYLSTDEDSEKAECKDESVVPRNEDNVKDKTQAVDSGSGEGSREGSVEGPCDSSLEGNMQEDVKKDDRKVNRRFPNAVDKDLKKNRSGKSFIIKTPVADSEKQVSLKALSTRRNSHGELNEDSDADLDLVATDANDDDDFKDSKVKRKVYTVVRKIRRTEINAEGKKVTKIIRQVVKKVCPVNADPFWKKVVGKSTEISEAKDQETVKNKGRDPKHRNAKDKGETGKLTSESENDKNSEDSSKAKGERKVPRSNSGYKALRCGKCPACVRKTDCRECENCRKKIASFPKKLNIICKMKQCREKVDKTQAEASKSVSSKEEARPVKKKTNLVHERKEMTVKSLASKKPNEAKKGSHATSSAPEKSVPDKPKPKSKSSRAGAKTGDSGDIVYSPGFKLRSQKSTEVQAKPNRILKEVQYSGMQPTVKLPWPEEQDEQSVCNSGNFFCVTTPITIATKDICFHCGSGGFQKMVTCIGCSEAYHEFCIEIDPLDENRWFCDRCKRCNVCGYKDNLLMCDKCHDCYHAECLGPNYHKQTEGVDDLWLCAKCVKCEKCGTKIPGKRKDSKWMRNFTLCEECDRRMRRGQFCPICENVYSENDYDTKMMYCSNCGKWIHMECEGLNADEYECLAELPEEIPYICKLCHSSEVWPRWYQEVREEMQAGFEKVYYELVASSDYKIVSKHLPEFKESDAKNMLDKIFEKVQRHEMSTVVDFKKAMMEFIEKLKELVIGFLPDQIILDFEILLRKQLKSMFSWSDGEDPKPDKIKAQIETTITSGVLVPASAVKTIDLDHTYHNTESNLRTENNGEVDTESFDKAHELELALVNTDSKSSSEDVDDNIFERLLCKEKSVSEVQDIMQDNGIRATPVLRIANVDSAHQILEGVGTTVKADLPNDAYSDVTSTKTESSGADPDLAGSSQNGVAMDDDTCQDVDAENLQGKIRTAKHNDDRRCQLCNQYGDDFEKDAGRMLYAGNNEWVHVNCALWSAEVYENDSGHLQNVHNAITRGQQLRCSTCRQWGATVGCCATSCQSNYHFMCGRNSSVIFQDNKLVYCEKHRAKSKSEVLLDGEGFVVARPVMVDLAKVSTLKKYNADHDPDSVNLYSGSLIVQRLGRLTDASNSDDVLLPIGFRATRLFWSTNDTRKRCKYYCTIEEVPVVTKPIAEEEGRSQCMSGWTICHVSKPTKRKERDFESVDENSLRKKQKPDDLEPSNGTARIETTVSCTQSPSYVGRPLKIGKIPLPTSGPRRSNMSSLVNTARSNMIATTCTVTVPSFAPVSVPGIKTISPTPKRPSYTKTSPQRNTPHKIIPQPSSQVSPFDFQGRSQQPFENVTKPRLIQPKLRYELVPTILQPDCTGSSKRPILPKFETPVVAIAQHLNYHLNTNPQMLHYVGDTTLQGLNRVLGSTYPSMLNSVPLSVSPNNAMLPCYTMNLPEAFWHTHTVNESRAQRQPFQVHKGNCVAGRRRKVDAQNQTKDDGGQEKGSTAVLDKAELMKKIHDCVKERVNSRIHENKNNTLNKVTEFQSEKNTSSDKSVLNSNKSLENNHQNLSRLSIQSSSATSEHAKNDLNGSSRELRQSNSGDIKSLPAFSELVGKLSQNDESGNSPCGNIVEDSPLSLNNITELSCLQAAAQLAKLMPEMFNEKELKTSALKTSVPCPDQVVTCASSQDTVAPDLRLDSEPERPSSLSKSCSAVLVSKSTNRHNRNWYHDQMEKLLKNGKETTKSSLRIHVKNEEGLQISGSSVQDIWKQLVDLLNETRTDQKLPTFLFNESEAFDFFGLSKFPVVFLAEQLPGGHKCRSYKFQFHLPCTVDEDKELPLNPHGCARAEAVSRRPPADMFAWLASPYRTLPKCLDEPDNDAEINKTASDLPLSMRFRQLKNSVKNHVGVYRSRIDGRGLFCKRQIEAGEMVIEYAGSVIRATLTDKRENYYEGKGYGCYMFRIDDLCVVDATLFGNEARFINHSCEPNCYSRIVSVDGEKHIVIFASRRIYPGEELTYDYKFPFEEEKLPCHCGSKKCRKYLN